MKYSIKHEPSYAMLVVDLKAGERIIGEAGAMTYISSNIDLMTRKREKRILGTLGMSLLGGQSLFVNDFSRGGPGGNGCRQLPPCRVFGLCDYQVRSSEDGRRRF
ncbi:MAG: AIM24 family protein [Candidatus Bathyarchaeota archaeon]|nr:AIM24 family protein [Candidatus Bathyarchaeota archaeon]